MVKKSASFVLARHCRLTIAAAFTSVTRFIQRVVNLRGSTYGLWEQSLSRQAQGGRGKNVMIRHLAGVHKRGAHYSSRRGPRWMAFLNIL
jgi:hypothetical protein